MMIPLVGTSPPTRSCMAQVVLAISLASEVSHIACTAMEEHGASSAEVGTCKSRQGNLADGTCELEAAASTCPEAVLSDGIVPGFPLNASHLRLRANEIRIWVCEQRDEEHGGILLVEGLMPRSFWKPPQSLTLDFLEDADAEILDFLGRDHLKPQLGPQDAMRLLRGTEDIQNVHHDRNNNADIFTSVLTYVTDEQSGISHGGHTIFPTVAVPGRSLDAQQRRLARYLDRTYEEKLRDLHGNHGALEGPGEVTDLVEDLCAQADRLQTQHMSLADDVAGQYFAIKPKRGMTLVLWNLLGQPREGTVRAEVRGSDHWHASCPHAGEKITHLRFAFLRPELLPATSPAQSTKTTKKSKRVAKGRRNAQ